MLSKIKQSWKVKDVRRRILYTLMMILIFRIGTTIPVPGVDTSIISKLVSGNSLLALYNMFTGGAFSNFTLFALGIGPYITASIIIQLLTVGFESLKELQKSGEEGRKKMNMYTRYTALVLAIIQAVGITLGVVKGALKSDNIFFITTVIITLIAASMILMWMGDRITEKGLGNGSSIIIFVGIISRIPTDIISVVNSVQSGTIKLWLAIILAIIMLITITLVTFINEAVRKIPVQYAKKVVGRKMVGAQNTHIPLKLAMAGVMPIIFASAFMTFPAMIIQIFVPDIATQAGFWSVIYKFSIATSSSAVPIGYTIANALVYLLLIVGFTFFYSYATFNPADISSTIKRNGGFIPGIRAGKPTTEYLSSVMSKLLWFGGLFLAVIAIIPMLARFLPIDLAFGGTSILIVVGVALEMIQQLESQLAVRHYKGFLE